MSLLVLMVYLKYVEKNKQGPRKSFKKFNQVIVAYTGTTLLVKTMDNQ